MDKIYERANEVHVKAFVVYGKAADHKLYYESTYTTQVTEEDLTNAFIKGLVLIKDSTTYRIPVQLVDNKVKTAGEVTAGGETSVSLVEWSALAAD